MITVFKKDLVPFYLALKGTEGVLSLSESRVRDSFMKPLLEATQTFEQDRKTIYEKFCEKDEKDAPLLTEKGEYQFEKEVVPELSKELETLYAEEVGLLAPEQLKEILEKTEYKPKTGETEIIDEILAKLYESF